jgi:hypothetical protein
LYTTELCLLKKKNRNGYRIAATGWGIVVDQVIAFACSRWIEQTTLINAISGECGRNTKNFLHCL